MKYRHNPDPHRLMVPNQHRAGEVVEATRIGLHR